jgi:hypothetical protein
MLTISCRKVRNHTVRIWRITHSPFRKKIQSVLKSNWNSFENKNLTEKSILTFKQRWIEMWKIWRKCFFGTINSRMRITLPLYFNGADQQSNEPKESKNYPKKCRKTRTNGIFNSVQTTFSVCTGNLGIILQSHTDNSNSANKTENGRRKKCASKEPLLH